MFELFIVITFCFFPRQAQRHVYLLYRERYGTVHPFSLCCNTFTCCLLGKKKIVKVSVFYLCGSHWCVAKFWYSGYMCHDMTKAGKSVCSGGKLWLMAAILRFPLPYEVQYTSQTNSITYLPSKCEAFGIRSWSLTSPFSADVKNAQSCKSMLLYKALGNVTSLLANTLSSYKGDIQF